jgi:K+-sensing histidine kinase KdpD
MLNLLDNASKYTLIDGKIQVLKSYIAQRRKVQVRFFVDNYPESLKKRDRDF